MHGTLQELDIITRIRGEVMRHHEPTGENLFLVWGYTTAAVLLIEFAALLIWNAEWCSWLWVGIPFIGTPLMIYYLNKDYQRTRHRTLNEKVLIMMWVFIGAACCLSSAALGFAGAFRLCFMSLLSFLCAFGCFMTGIILHFVPKTICGIIATLLSAIPLFFQDDLWPWQLIITAFTIVIALIIPGHLFKNYVKHYESV